ncbi:hypothetical protein D8674_041131 [Pyrus ussuriensis x Pyrus communis]|uniref:Uncharacterized protein n=1 Tax=Pyrus ussuriensis x Pyrus communis TaxID=2448454 RepID=A0A5N5FQT6_9ROSA|nr:hypothetical protein D8674_041131 [Pyrus ussuriensis x Pyrus communis]
MTAMVVWENEIHYALHTEAVAAGATVQVEGDALMVIFATHNERSSHHGRYGHLFADTRQNLQSFKQ